MSLFLWVRFLHVASAMWFIGGILARQIVRLYAKRTDDVQRFAALTEAARRLDSTMVIPGNFAVMNLYRLYGLRDHAMSRYQAFGPERENNLPASACLECGQCEPKCPQRIPVIAQLQETDLALGGK